MLKEGAPGFARPALPKFLVVRAEAIHNAAPIATVLSCLFHEFAEPAQEVAHLAAERHVGGIDGYGLDRLVLAGQEAMTRDDQRAAEVGGWSIEAGASWCSAKAFIGIRSIAVFKG